MIKAKWGKMNILQKIPCILIYFPFFIYVKLQKILFKVKNQKTGWLSESGG